MVVKFNDLPVVNLTYNGENLNECTFNGEIVWDFIEREKKLLSDKQVIIKLGASDVVKQNISNTPYWEKRSGLQISYYPYSNDNHPTYNWYDDVDPTLFLTQDFYTNERVQSKGSIRGLAYNTGNITLYCWNEKTLTGDLEINNIIPSSIFIEYYNFFSSSWDVFSENIKIGGNWAGRTNYYYDGLARVDVSNFAKKIYNPYFYIKLTIKI